MSWATWLWLAIAAQAAALETYALATDHRDTLSQTLQRAFAHAPWLAAIGIAAFGGWFLLHIFAPLIAHASKATVRVVKGFASRNHG